MSFGTTFTSYRDNQGGNKQVAPLLHEKWPHEQQRPAIGTLASRLSDLVAEKQRGVKFFFDDLAVSALLFDVLVVPTGEREALLEEAKSIAEGRPAAKLVIEVSALVTHDRDTTDVLFKLFEESIPHSLAPVAVVLTESQYRWLPRSIEPPRFVIHRVADEAGGRAKAGELAERRGLLWSPNRGNTPADRWEALAFDGSALRSYPDDGLAAYAKLGHLPVPPPPGASLLSLGVVGNGTVLPQDPLDVRRLFDQLPDPACAARLGLPAKRVALADLLGIPAAATEKECIDADVANIASALGVPPTASDSARLAAIVERAGRRQVGPTLLRVGDELHAINIPNATAKGRLRVHAVSPRPAMITRLREVVRCRTRDEWRDDRFIDRGFVPSEGETLAFETARAGLLSTGVEPVDAPPDPAWQEALAALVQGAPPAAQLYLEPAAREGASTSVFVMTQAEIAAMSHGKQEEDRGYWQRVPALRGSSIGRADPTFVISSRVESISYQHPLIPFGIEALADTDFWLDVLDAEEEARRQPVSSESARRQTRSAFTHRHAARILGSQAWKTWTGQELVIDADMWRSADHHIAFAWLAIARAAGHLDAVTLHDGSGLLPLGHGIFAAVRARRHGNADRPVEAALMGEVSRNPQTPHPWRLDPLTATAITHTAETGSYRTTSGPALPRALYIVGKGWAVDITFVASPLFASEQSTLADARGALAAAAAVAGPTQHQD